MTVAESILARAKALLNTGTPVGVPQATRCRVHALETSALPAIDLYPLTETLHPIHPKPEGNQPGAQRGVKTGDPVQRWLDLQVDCIVAGDPDGDPSADTAVDPLREWVTKALCGGDWQGLVTSCNELVTKFEPQNTKDVPVLAAQTTFRCFFTSKAGDPTVRS